MQLGKLLTAALACVYSLGLSQAALADDIDIFFGGPDDENVGRPNVLFVLDNSGSMRWDLDYNDDPRGGDPSRMDVLQNAFNEIMTGASGINAGLMTLNGTRKLYPITNIDQAVDSGSEEIPTTPRLTEDGRETSAGDVFLAETEISLLPAAPAAALAASSKTHLLGTHPSLIGEATSYRGKKYQRLSSDRVDSFRIYSGWGMGLVFDDVQIPAGATITKATLQLHPKGSSGRDWQWSSLKISADNRTNPVTFSSRSVKPKLGSAVNFYIKDIHEGGGFVQFGGLASLLQQVLTQKGSLNGIGLYLDLNSNDSFYFYGPGVTNKAPRLLLELDNAGDDSAGQLVALRFTDIPVPQGATIESAELELTSSSDSDNNLDVEIKIENSGNTAELSDSSYSLSRRATHNNLITWSTSGAWERGKQYSSPDLSSLISAATNHSDWCGNNAITLLLRAKPGSSGLRNFYSKQGAGQAPRLKLNYKADSSGNSCINPYVYRRVLKSEADIFQSTSRSSDTWFGTNYLRISSSYNGGIRFDKLPLKPGAKILDARLGLTLYQDSRATEMSLLLDNSANSTPFSGARYELRDRASNGYGPVKWAIPADIDAGTQIVSPDFSAQLQKIVDKGSWNSQQAISLILQSNDSSQYFSAYDHSQGRAPLLMLKIQSGGVDTTPSYTVRDKLIDLVNNMSAGGGTPIAPTMLDAANYYKGKSGNSQWPNPMEFACQPNHLVLLTDGQANSSSYDTQSKIGSLINNSNCYWDSSRDGERCVRSLSHWLGNTDLNASLDEINDVTVHTIGFAMGSDSTAKTFMRDLAQQNQGCTDAEMAAWEADPDNAEKNCGFYLPTNASALVDAFNEIFNSINSIDSTFVSPGASVNQFNRSQHNNELYFSLFKPLANERWPGNIKRYALYGQSTSQVDVVDVFNNKAVDPTTGFFKENARSFWSNGTDGNLTEKGGMLSKLPAPSERKLYTAINDKISPITQENTALTEAMLGASDADERKALINWARGLDEKGAARNAIGDPLHSRPAIVTYRCREWLDDQMRECKPASGSGTARTEYTESSLLFGTNEGYLHAINTNAQSGQELFAFMPQELLGNIKVWKANPQISKTRRYGLDGSPTLWINDANRNGVIYGGRDTSSSTVTELPTNKPNDGEFVYAYIGMRRGGHNYYALDITDPKTPKALWTIKGRQGEFTRLGQTWSRPIKTRVKIGSTVHDVLIFSGGYDDSQDQDEASIYNQYQGTYKTDSVGNAIYMVDAKTGGLLWSASAPNDPGRSHNLTLNQMNYSIPGGVRAVDIYGDGLADQLFFADLGGQVWRLYINNGADLDNLVWPADSGTEASPQGDGSASSNDGVMAYLGYPASAKDRVSQRRDARRFYHAPDISVFRKNGIRYLAVAIGSGFHADPLSKISPETGDAFFLLTSTAVYNPDLTNSSVLSGKKVPTQQLLTLGGGRLKDMTNDFSSDPIGTDPNISNGGWYIRLRAKELVTAPSITQEGIIYFNTYEPGVRASSCNATTGLGRAYEVKLTNGAPSADVTNPSHSKRYTELKSGGLPPETIILKPDPNFDQICIGAECKTKERTPQSGRTYWREVE